LPAASAGEWATIAYLGVCQIGLAYICLTRAISRLPALEVSLLLLVEPVLNPLWTWLLRGEEPGLWTIAGGAIILSATAVRSMHAARSPAATDGGGGGGTAPPPSNASRSARQAHQQADRNRE
jgi:drug/metabolite transporter (DMT)-like permease